MLDDNYDPYQDPYSPDAPQYPAPGANQGSGPWAPGYDPGPNYNGGTPPGAPSPYNEYNGGSPVNAPLQAGYGWEWSGPQSPMWNMSTNNWDFGSWNQVQGRGLGLVNPTGGPGPTGGPTPPPPTGGGGGPRPTFGGGGAVPSLGNSGINVPSSTLPGDISALFGKVPEKTPIQSAYQDALLKYMARSQETPTLDDSILGPQTEVFRAQQQRNQERNRRVASERAAASGQSQSGYLDNLINKGIQEQAFNTASFNANLLGSEMGKRREELQAALQLANATGNAEAARELQTRLAQASAMMQQQALNLQGQLGSGDLAMRMMLAQMGNNQFYDQLGVNTALNLEGLNQRALQLIMNGLGGGNG